ncbi:MAG: glutamate racemase [Methylophilaceae bacterium]|nr:glutamate racemase [Methylophilaceae bacterium]
MIDPSAPVGVFDSGVGGLSVLRHIRQALPREDILYVADSAHAPYGSKTPQQIQARALALAEFLAGQGAKALVIACNTATAAAAPLLRERYGMPIVGMEPAVKPAVAATRSGVVGVLATSGTLQSARFAALLENYGRGVRVVTQAAHGLVESVERGEVDTPQTRALLWQYLEPLLQEGADTLVLGCTHYPFLRRLIQSLVGEGMTLIDTGAAVARQLHRRLEAAGLLRQDTHAGVEHFWTSGDAATVQRIIRRLWEDEKIEVHRL